MARTPSDAMPAPDPARSPGLRRAARQRLRVAWMYHVEGMTQNAIAEALGIGRVTVIRLLNQARQLHEVKIALSRSVAELPRLESALERRFGLKEAIVAPLSAPEADPTAVIGAATGPYLSDLVQPGMRIGVGWGRTLLHVLDHIEERPVPGLQVVSMLGGISAVRQYNPAEFAWSFSRLFHADCYLIAAPAIVDSPQTRDALILRCGIGRVLDEADSLDAAVVSVGSMAPASTSFQFDQITEADRRSLLAAGAVGDILNRFFDRTGAIVAHPLAERVMSVAIEQLRKAPHRVLTSGGPDKTLALLGALRLLRPTVLITDEHSALRILDAAAQDDPEPPPALGPQGA